MNNGLVIVLTYLGIVLFNIIIGGFVVFWFTPNTDEQAVQNETDDQQEDRRRRKRADSEDEDDDDAVDVDEELDEGPTAGYKHARGNKYYNELHNYVLFAFAL